MNAKLADFSPRSCSTCSSVLSRALQPRGEVRSFSHVTSARSSCRRACRVTGWNRSRRSGSVRRDRSNLLEAVKAGPPAQALSRPSTHRGIAALGASRPSARGHGHARSLADRRHDEHLQPRHARASARRCRQDECDLVRRKVAHPSYRKPRVFGPVAVNWAVKAAMRSHRAAAGKLRDLGGLGQWSHVDSNHGPPACEAGALTS